jgi:proteasome lid subunit RPN8/RPN11
MPASLWRSGLAELRRRGGGYRESGAFLLGTVEAQRRRAQRFVYYDDVEPHCLDGGYVFFDGTGYGALWAWCREAGLEVVGDIHTHPMGVGQSTADREHPMVATPGHIALIVPNYARRAVAPAELGIYVYEGQHCWRTYVGAGAARFMYVSRWG